MFGRKGRDYGYDECCTQAYDNSVPGAGIDAYALAQAIREVAKAPEPVCGPKQILLAEEGTIVNPRDLPANVTVVYVAPGDHPSVPLPQLHSVGF